MEEGNSFITSLFENGGEFLDTSMETGSEPVIESTQDNLLPLVLEDIRLSMAARRQRMRQCLFFHLVRGGNTKVVDTILTFLEENGHNDELNWLLDKKRKEKPSTLSVCYRRFVQTVLFICSLGFIIVTTPVFYAIHAAGLSLYAPNKKPISDDPALPLVFAVYSEDPEMVKLFLKRGIELSDVDSNLNNIYHYISDISNTNPRRAIIYHELLMSCISDVEQVKGVVMYEENMAGLTPLETCARWGSMEFFRHLAMEKGIIQDTLVKVGKDSVWINDNYLGKMNSRKYIMSIRDHKNITLSQTDNPEIHVKNRVEVAEYDLHRYERGDTLGKQSYLLHLIAARKVEDMTERDLNAFLQTDFLHTWIKRKRRRFMYQCIISHLVHIVITVLLLLYLLHFGGDMNPFPLLESLVEEYLKVSLDLLLDSMEGSLSKMMDTGKYGVVNVTVGGGPHTDFVSSSTISIIRNNYHTFNLQIDDIVLFCHNKSQIVGGLVLNQCLAKALYNVIDNCPGLGLQSALEFSGIKMFLTSPDSEEMKTEEIISHALQAFMFIHICIDFIYRIIFLVRNFRMTKHFPYVSFLNIATRRFPGSYIEKQLVSLMYWLFVLYLFIFTNLEHKLTSYLTVTFHVNLENTISTIQQNLSSMPMMATDNKDILMNQMNKTREMVQAEISYVEQNNFLVKELLPLLNNSLHVMSYLLITCLILRFLLAIHVMRLLPGIGFFIITVRKMAQHLVQFVSVFLLVAVGFATIFHFVMRDPSCPANRVTGFSDLTEGMFSTYLIALGQAEFDFFENPNGQVAFIVYTVISILLLFNLVIAVMSATADFLNRKAWRQALSSLEEWDEILGVEATCQTMTSPLICCTGIFTCFYKKIINHKKKSKDVEMTYYTTES